MTQEGNKILIQEGLDKKGNVVAEKYACDKENCNCIGTCVNGNEREVEEWINVND